MNKKELWQQIDEAYKQDLKNNPSFPVHICGQTSMVTSAAGKLSAAGVMQKYGGSNHQTVVLRQAAIDTIVNAFRFLEHLK